MRKLFTDAVWLQICTILSGSRNGNGRRSTAFMTLKIPVFAPIPSASVSTATAVKPGFFTSWRKANLISFIAQRLHRIDSRRAPRGQPTGHHNWRSVGVVTRGKEAAAQEGNDYGLEKC